MLSKSDISERGFKNSTALPKKYLELDSFPEAESSDIKLLSVISDRGPSYYARPPGTKDYGESHHYRNKKPKTNQKPKEMLSVLKTIGKGMGLKESDDSGSDYHHNLPVYPVESSQGGWGGENHHHYHQKHVYTVKGSGGGHSMYFSFLDIVLTGLSLVSFGAFLLNLLLNLLSLGGFFTSTATYPTYTGTSTGGTNTGGTSTGGTSTGGTTTGGTSTGGTSTGGTSTGGTSTATGTGPPITGSGISGYGVGDILKNNWFTRTFTKKKRRKTKKKGKNAKIRGDVGFGLKKGKRKKRAPLELYVDPKSSLDIAARSILNSIESMQNKYECMEKVICDSNKHAGVIGQGLDVFMPIYSLTASYFGRKLGLHEEIPNHLSAIILGVQESDCQSHFPQCESKAS